MITKYQRRRSYLSLRSQPKVNYFPLTINNNSGITPQVDAEGNPIPPPEGDAEPKKSADADAAKETTPVKAEHPGTDGKRKSVIPEVEKPKYVIPDITSYDQEMVQAKAKLKLNFGEGHSYGTFDALVRLQFGLNRDITREELARHEWEENNK